MSLLLDQLSLVLGMIALLLGVGSLLICILSLLVIGIATPLGLMKIDFTEEIEDFSTSIDEAAISLVTVPGRASRHLCSLLTFALLASFEFLSSTLARTVHSSSLLVKRTIKVLITALSWLAKGICKGVSILLSSPSSHALTAQLAVRLEQEVVYLRGQAISHEEDVRKLYEKVHMHQRAAYAAEKEANQAKSAKIRQDALVARQKKTIETLQKEIDGIPQEHLQLREKNAELEQKVNELEEKLGKALDARNDVEEKKRKTADEAISMVADAQKEQHWAEMERDQAKSYFEKLNAKLEERQKASMSEIVNLKNELAKKPLLHPKFHLQTVEQARTYHNERDDARDALTSVTAQLGEAKTAEAAGQRQLKNLHAELALVENQTGRELRIAQKELAKTKAEAEKVIKAARSKAHRCRRQSEADRVELTKAQRSLEEKKRQHGDELFELGQKHNVELWTAQGQIKRLKASNEDFRALRDALDEKLVHAEEQARLPRDPELQNRLFLATAEVQRLRTQHATELQVLREEHSNELQRLWNDYVTDSQNRETELLQKCEEVYNKQLAKWRVDEEKLGQEVGHWRSVASRAEANIVALNRNTEQIAHEREKMGQEADQWRSKANQAEVNIMTLNRDAERIAHERERREQEFTATLQRCEAEAIKRCEEAYAARLDGSNADTQQLQGQFDELQNQFLRTKEELEDLRASASQDKNLVVAEKSELYMGQKDFEAYYSSLTPAQQEALMKERDFDFELEPLQTSPTSPPLDPAPVLDDPEPEPTFVLDPQLLGISTPSQAPIPLAAPGAPTKGMVPRGPRKPKSRPNHYTQRRREEEAAYDAGLGDKLDYMFFGGPEPSRGAPAAAQSVPSGIIGSPGFGKIP